MRSRLFFAGAMMLIFSAVLFVLQLPLVFFWSIPFGISGIIMMIVAPFLKESEGPVKPPDGYVFCVYCSNVISASATRCNYCNGKQPRES
jgi:hypothetical protein